MPFYAVLHCHILYWDLGQTWDCPTDVLIPFLVFFLPCSCIKSTIRVCRLNELLSNTNTYNTNTNINTNTNRYTKLFWSSTASLQTKWIIEQWLKSITQPGQSNVTIPALECLADSANIQNIKFLDDDQEVSEIFSSEMSETCQR